MRDPSHPLILDGLHARRRWLVRFVAMSCRAIVAARGGVACCTHRASVVSVSGHWRGRLPDDGSAVESDDPFGALATGLSSARSRIATAEDAR